MRIPKYLSPSALGLWESDRQAYYLKNLAETRPPRMPQENYMSIGSAFDAYVKAALYEAVVNEGDPQYEFEALFEEQVEPHNRDWARKAGLYAFEAYEISGAYGELLADLTASEFPPKFEFTISKDVYGVPLLGKPDCMYIDKSGVQVVLDWKVNGFCSRSGSSPYKGYRIVRDGWTEATAKPSRGAGSPHKMFEPMKLGELTIGSHYLEQACTDWADQLAIYSWMLDVPIGSEENVIRMEQLVCKPRDEEFPLIRVANHICRISKGWQEALVKRLCDCWNAITSDHIFDNLSLEDSRELCEILEQQAAGMYATAEDGSIEEWAYARARSRRYR